ncbi:MAG: hypothetical protein EZS26_000092 [Candidatus Ordinivivax streblomastigis]|uniref:Uncharacterized protein n=1 Tax=Candidatus Ordinivivax streblomastigis TaxID=2540710 RepID=A0A5M8P554_9BACT|nr:MAG: hypothetical protein EZS26_000092 [Candidatus Ordinivivax streblomastigis]
MTNKSLFYYTLDTFFFIWLQKNALYSYFAMHSVLFRLYLMYLYYKGLVKLPFSK